ncbi:MAG: type III-B CRISPR module-associated protein Cmr3 [Anaerolineae bacterium]|nr:type III-B CRISPR module-associated protein Cmr3 [Anaerolineae bacterium]
MWLFIEATDVWLFRDGRPFDAGSDHRAGSHFPPAPTTIQGAIRAQVLALNSIALAAYRRGKGIPDDVSVQIGNPQGGGPGEMRLRGPFLGQQQADGSVMPYFPCPADVLHVNSSDIKKLVPLFPDENPPFATNWPADNLQPLTFDPQVAGDETPEGSQAWISAKALQAYLAGNISTDSFSPKEVGQAAEMEADLDATRQFGAIHLKRATSLFTSEYRLGIGVDGNRKRPSDGMLYTITYVRPHENVGLLVEVMGLDEAAWGRSGLLSLGGEGRAARYTIITAPAAWPQHQPDGRKLYLASPTYFSHGWQPAAWSTYFANAGNLQSAVVRRHQLIGGWELAANQPKPMQRYVPAGSVYYFDGRLEDPQKPVCDDTEAARIGFGLTFIGR